MIGVLLLGFGGPRSLDDIEGFLVRLTGRVPSPQQLDRVRECYSLIGGRSPLLEIAERQAQALEARLNGRRSETANEFKVLTGMRYSSPTVADALDGMTKAGIKRVVCVSLSPYRSRTSTSAYYEEAVRAAANLESPPSLSFAADWFDHPLYLDALAGTVRRGLTLFGDADPGGIEVLFSAHSLPASYVEEGDLYVDQLRTAVAGVLERLRGDRSHQDRDAERVAECRPERDSEWTGRLNGRLVFQSVPRGAAAGSWLAPLLEDVLTEIAAAGFEGAREPCVLVVPVGFISDHIETLYDIDIASRLLATELGLRFERAACLNDSPALIEALAAVVEETAGDEKGAVA